MFSKSSGWFGLLVVGLAVQTAWANVHDSAASLISGTCLFTISPVGQRFPSDPHTFEVTSDRSYVNMVDCYGDLVGRFCPSVSAEDLYDLAVWEGFGNDLVGPESMADTAFFKPICRAASGIEEPQPITEKETWRKWKPLPPAMNQPIVGQDLEKEFRSFPSMNRPAAPTTWAQLWRGILFAILLCVLIVFVLAAIAFEAVGVALLAILAMFGVMDAQEASSPISGTLVRVSSDYSHFQAQMKIDQTSYTVRGDMLADGDLQVCMTPIDRSSNAQKTCLTQTHMYRSYASQANRLWSMAFAWLWP
ncbi:MAG: hypothetical protein R3A11_05950 [Bdellovibrionota bacterium]